MTHAIQADGLEKRFGETRALAGVSLTAPPGTVLGVLGPNGAGKTTMTRILATLIEPTAGSARVGGYDVVKEAHKVRQLIGLTGQYAGVDEMLTGTENLVLIGRLLGMSRRASKARAAELLDRFQLTDAAERAAKTYSGGMRRRLDLAASLVGRPQILFLDEPTTGLDPRARRDVWRLVRDLRDRGVTVLLVTHSMEEAQELCDRIAIIDAGRVRALGTPDELVRTGTAATIVSFEVPGRADLDVLRGLDGVTTVRVDDRRVVVEGAEDVVLAVLAALDAQRVVPQRLRVAAGSLDTAYLDLTTTLTEETA